MSVSVASIMETISTLLTYSVGDDCMEYTTAYGYTQTPTDTPIVGYYIEFEDTDYMENISYSLQGYLNVSVWTPRGQAYAALKIADAIRAKLGAYGAKLDRFVYNPDSEGVGENHVMVFDIRASAE
jgi:hypothetical protein